MASSNVDFAMVAPGAEGYQCDHPCAEHQTVIDADAGTATLSRKKIAICGFASSSRHHIPIDNPEWSLWLLNQLYRHCARADRHFDIHLNWREDNIEGTDHPRFLKTCGIPVYMADLGALAPEPRSDYPTAVRYPIERMIEKHGLDYFTSTVAFMIALAIDEIDRAVAARMEADELRTVGDYRLSQFHALVKSIYAEYTIGIFGIDLVVGTEYDWQKACVEYWLGEASARGIVTMLPPECALLKQLYRYGYAKEPASGVIPISEKKARYAELSTQQAKIKTRVGELNGHAQIVERLKAEPDADKDAILKESRSEWERALKLIDAIDGAMQECAHDINVTEFRLRGAQVAYTQGGA